MRVIGWVFSEELWLIIHSHIIHAYLHRWQKIMYHMRYVYCLMENQDNQFPWKGVIVS